jgi:hypothetical protein
MQTSELLLEVALGRTKKEAEEFEFVWRRAKCEREAGEIKVDEHIQ